MRRDYLPLIPHFGMPGWVLVVGLNVYLTKYHTGLKVSWGFGRKKLWNRMSANSSFATFAYKFLSTGLVTKIVIFPAGSATRNFTSILNITFQKNSCVYYTTFSPKICKT